MGTFIQFNFSGYRSFITVIPALSLLSCAGSPDVGSHGGGLLAMTVKMISSLAIVVAVIFVLVHLARRYFPDTVGVDHGDGLINVVSVKYIGTRQKLMLLKVVDEMVLVSVSGNDISMLSKIASGKAGLNGVAVNEVDNDNGAL